MEIRNLNLNKKCYCIAEFKPVGTDKNKLEFVRFQTYHNVDSFTDVVFYKTLEDAERALKSCEDTLYKTDWFKGVFKIIEVNCKLNVL